MEDMYSANINELKFLQNSGTFTDLPAELAYVNVCFCQFYYNRHVWQRKKLLSREIEIGGGNLLHGMHTWWQK
jgi:hypothetical protein